MSLLISQTKAEAISSTFSLANKDEFDLTSVQGLDEPHLEFELSQFFYFLIALRKLEDFLMIL